MPRCIARRMRGETGSRWPENVCGLAICYGHCDRNNPPLRIAERGNDRLQPVLTTLAMLGYLESKQVYAMKKTLLLIASVAVLLSGCIVVPDGGGYYGGGGYYHHRHWD